MDHKAELSTPGYNTPLHELNDSHQTALGPRPGHLHTGQGAFDSFYATRLDREQANVSGPTPSSEEAVADDDGHDIWQVSSRGRRPTPTSSERRSISPPNSVKAFAEARRRGRELSISETRTVDRREAERQSIEAEIARTMSVGSRSHAADRGSACLATNSSAEEDVCYPNQGRHREDNLYIDFDCLKALVESEKQHEHAARVFPSLRPESTVPGPILLPTADGEFIDTLPHKTSSQEKNEIADRNFTPLPSWEQQHHPDPNQFSFFSSVRETTIHATEFGGLVLPGEDIRSLFTFPERESDGVWWLNMSNPNEEQVRAICKAFRIHPLTIEDVIAQETREKIELFPSYYFACFRTFRCVDQPDGINYIPFNIYAVVFRKGILSFSFVHNTHAPQVRIRISKLKDYVSLSSDWICYALIDDVVDSFAPVIYEVQRETDTIEDQLFAARPNDAQEFLRRIGRARKKTMVLMRLLGGKADILRGFTKRCNESFNVTPRMGIALYLGDIQDHAVTMTNNLIHFDRMLSRSHSNYLAQLSIDNITQGNQTNESLRRVTVITTVLVPLVVVCGLFGMNVKVPWQDENNLNAFSGILGGIIFFAITSLIIARRMRYI